MQSRIVDAYEEQHQLIQHIQALEEMIRLIGGVTVLSVYELNAQ